MLFEGVIENVIPKKIGFDGLLMLTNVSIKSSFRGYTFRKFSDLTRKSFCVRLCICIFTGNGDLQEMCAIV